MPPAASTQPAALCCDGPACSGRLTSGCLHGVGAGEFATRMPHGPFAARPAGTSMRPRAPRFAPRGGRVDARIRRWRGRGHELGRCSSAAPGSGGRHVASPPDDGCGGHDQLGAHGRIASGARVGAQTRSAKAKGPGGRRSTRSARARQTGTRTAGGGAFRSGGRDGCADTHGLQLRSALRLLGK